MPPMLDCYIGEPQRMGGGLRWDRWTLEVLLRLAVIYLMALKLRLGRFLLIQRTEHCSRHLLMLLDNFGWSSVNDNQISRGRIAVNCRLGGICTKSRKTGVNLAGKRRVTLSECICGPRDSFLTCLPEGTSNFQVDGWPESKGVMAENFRGIRVR